MSKYVLVHWTSRAKKTPVYGPFPDVKAAYKFKADNRRKIPELLYFNPHVLIEHEEKQLLADCAACGCQIGVSQLNDTFNCAMCGALLVRDEVAVA
jgi:predicted RNA-binding Zn-ribbon protein involved in translation (DUF1610 family)